MRSNYGAPVRELLLERTRIRYLIDFGDLPVFGATTYPLILIVELEKSTEATKIVVGKIEDLDFYDLARRVDDVRREVRQFGLSRNEWGLTDIRESELLVRLEVTNESLLDFLGKSPQMGVKTGLNEAFIINLTTRTRLLAADPTNAEIIFPLCTGAHIRRYKLEWNGDYLIYTHHGIDISKYPAIVEHLKPYQSKLLARATRQEWYELQQPQEAYKLNLLAPKIIMPDLAERARFCIDRTGMFTTNTGYFLSTADPYLLALLNSSPVNFYLTQTSATFRGGYIRLFGQYVERIPIRRINFTTPADERKRLLAEAKTLAAEAVSTDAFGPTLRFVSDQLTAEPERSDVVHDLLAHLAEQMMIELNKRRQKLERALDPFKWLDRGAAFVPFTQVFAEEIKYGELVRQPDLGAVRHDVEKLRLTPLGPPSQGGSEGGGNFRP